MSAVTLIPVPVEGDGGGSTSPLCIFCGDFGGLDFTLNVLLFVPFGLGLRLAGLSVRRAALVALATTFGIELLQLHAVSGRDASVGDLVANTSGSMLGYGLAMAWRPVLAPGPRAAWIAACVGAAAWALALGAASALLRPAPPAGTFFGQWGPHLEHLDLFEGTLVDATLNGARLPSGVMSETKRAAEGIRQGRVSLAATVLPAGPTEHVAPIASVFDSDQQEVVLLGQHGRDLVFRVRMRATDLLLKVPTFRLEDVFPASGGERDSLHIAGVLDWPAIHLERRVGESVIRRTIRLSPVGWWSLFWPFGQHHGTQRPLVSALWLAVTLAPVGYWLGWTTPGGSRPTRSGAALLAAALIAGLWLLPARAGMPVAEWEYWVAALLGAVGGLWLADRARAVVATPAGAVHSGLPRAVPRSAP